MSLYTGRLLNGVIIKLWTALAYKWGGLYTGGLIYGFYSIFNIAVVLESKFSFLTLRNSFTARWKITVNKKSFAKIHLRKRTTYIIKWSNYLNPIKFRASLIFAKFIFGPLIFAQLNNSYIRARIIFTHWRNLYFRVGLSFETLKVFPGSSYINF